MKMSVVPTKYGMFMEHTYLGTGGTPPAMKKGDPIEDKGREGGLNFKATVGRTGKNNDATFDKFEFIHEGDNGYIEPRRKELIDKMEAKKKNVTEMPFKAASPMKHSTTPGDYIGTIGGKVPNMATTVDIKKKKGDYPEVQRGIFTSPAKKGTFGMNKTTLSERQGYKGVATEYEYQHDPEEMHVERRRAAQEAHRKACVSDLPFKPSNPPKRGGPGVPNTTISKGKGVAGEWEYVTPTDPTAKKSEKKIETPFRPSQAHAGGRTNHIEYIHDPEEPKMEKAAAKKKAEAAKLAATGAWRPNMNKKSDFTRSIVRMNI